MYVCTHVRVYVSYVCTRMYECICMNGHCSYDNSLSKYCFHHDNNCITWFVEELQNLAHKINTILSTNVPMADFTRDD